MGFDCRFCPGNKISKNFHYANIFRYFANEIIYEKSNLIFPMVDRIRPWHLKLKRSVILSNAKDLDKA